MSNGTTRWTGLAIVGFGMGWLAGCTTAPTFTVGSGDLLGTMTSSNGTYQIFKDSAGNPSRVESGDGSVFNFDSQGRVSGITSPNGDSFSLQYDDAANQITVTINDSDIGNGSFTFPAPDTSSRPRASDAAATPGVITALSPRWTIKQGQRADETDGEFLDYQTFCLITNACLAFDLFITLYFDELVDQAQREAEAQLGFAPRFLVETAVRKYLKPYQDFCGEWNALVLDLPENPCA